ncbi:uncharacterized protein [Nicotiana tomentosiformis]|uniref:uncharacterized protein n=1 Tax=Nicotiana tomentosiformis TaxID=4098 RepID=UPI00388CC75D
MAPYEALYGRWCCSPVGWFEPGEARLLGTDLVRGVLEKVKLIQDRLRTTQSRQKSYVDRRACDIAFMVGERVLLRVLPMKDFISVQLDKDLTYVEEPMAIMEMQVLKLRSKNIALIKVQWRGKPVEEATWETKHDMRSPYPHLFGTSGCWSAGVAVIAIVSTSIAFTKLAGQYEISQL